MPLAKDRKEALPGTASQAKKWTEVVADKLPQWVADEVAPLIKDALAKQGLEAMVKVEASNVEIHHEPAIEGYAYVRPRILVEFGGRSTGEPCDEHDIECDAAPHLADVGFPAARPRTMRAERTFWEKATAVHAFAKGGRLPGDAIARHWLDLLHLDAVGVADHAATDGDLARQVADHKKLFFKVGTPNGPVDYHAAVAGGLELVPPDASRRAALDEDYARMIDARLPHGETAPTFAELMDAAPASRTRSTPPPATSFGDIGRRHACDRRLCRVRAVGNRGAIFP